MGCHALLSVPCADFVHFDCVFHSPLLIRGGAGKAAGMQWGGRTACPVHTCLQAVHTVVVFLVFVFQEPLLEMQQLGYVAKWDAKGCIHMVIWAP